MNDFARTYRRDCLLGALGAALMLVGDLCLSVIPASAGDSGLFLRAAYFDGAFQPWRLPLLVGTGMLGMALGFFSVRAVCASVLPQCRRTRLALRVGGAIYLTSAGAVHLLIGSLADWTGTLAPLLGREETAALVQAQYERVMPSMLLAYAGMVLMILTSAWAVLTKRTVLPRRLFIFHMLTWQLVLMLIPDVRQLLGAPVSTWDFVLSQGSGNAALLIWMLANAVWAPRGKAAANMTNWQEETKDDRKGFIGGPRPWRAAGAGLRRRHPERRGRYGASVP